MPYAIIKCDTQKTIFKGKASGCSTSTAYTFEGTCGGSYGAMMIEVNWAILGFPSAVKSAVAKVLDLRPTPARTNFTGIKGDKIDVFYKGKMTKALVKNVTYSGGVEIQILQPYQVLRLKHDDPVLTTGRPQVKRNRNRENTHVGVKPNFASAKILQCMNLLEQHGWRYHSGNHSQGMVFNQPVAATTTYVANVVTPLSGIVAKAEPL